MHKRIKKGILSGFALFLATTTGVTMAEAGHRSIGNNICAIPSGVPPVAGEYMMSFRYLLPSDPEGIEVRGSRKAFVKQCNVVVKVTVEQPGSNPERVTFYARINEFGEASVDQVNFGLTGGSPEEVIVRDMAVAMSEGGNFYGSAYLDNSALGVHDGSRVLFVFEPLAD